MDGYRDYSTAGEVGEVGLQRKLTSSRLNDGKKPSTNPHEIVVQENNKNPEPPHTEIHPDFTVPSPV